MFEGFHTDMQGRNLNESDARRCRRIWWTIYVLDHRLTSLLGLPISMRESEVLTSRPDSDESTQRPEILDIHVCLSKIIAQIVESKLSESSNWSFAVQLIQL